MLFKDKHILIVSPEPWSHIFVSKHHYAVHLAKQGNKVYFLNPPSLINKVNTTGFDNVWEVNYTGFPKGLRFLPSLVQKLFIKNAFQELQKHCQVKFNIIWSFDNSVFFDFSALPHEVLKISHIVDLNQNFQIARAAGTANICFCTTDFIKERLLKFNKNVYKINHGLSVRGRSEFTPTLPGANNVKALYVGNLAMPYLDWQCLKRVAFDCSDVDFVFIGSGKDEFSEKINRQHQFKIQMLQRKNVYFLNKVPSEYILAYLSGADVLLVAYQEEHHKDQANPHKMMEYLGSGKMIVATYTEEYAALSAQGFFLMSKQNSEFSHLFKSAVQRLERWNSTDKQKARQNFASDNTYEKQLERIENYITQLSK